MLLSIDRTANVPVYRQVYEQIMTLVDEGTLCPGTRLPATRVLARRLGLNFSTLSGNGLGQAAVERFCASGAYEAHLRRTHKAYRRRMQTMLASLAEHMPVRGVTWTQPVGGYTLWVHLPSRRVDEEDEVVRQINQAGVLVSPGSLYFPGRADGLYFRLSVSNLDEARITEGCRRLGRALAELAGG